MTLPEGIERYAVSIPDGAPHTVYGCTECGRSADGWAIIQHRPGCETKARWNSPTALTEPTAEMREQIDMSQPLTSNQMQRGRVARAMGITVTMRVARQGYICFLGGSDHVNDPIIRPGDLHGVSWAGGRYCLACCEPVPAAARERELAERQARDRVHESALEQQLAGSDVVQRTCIHVVPQWDVLGRPWDVGLMDRSKAVLLVDIQGGLGPVGSKARKHGSAEGYRTDCRKLAEAVRLGYRAIFVTGQQVQSGEALQLIEAILTTPPAPGGTE